MHIQPKLNKKAKKAVVKGLGSPLFPFSAVLVICNCKSCFGVTKVLNTTYTTNNILYMEAK